MTSKHSQVYPTLTHRVWAATDTAVALAVPIKVPADPTSPIADIYLAHHGDFTVSARSRVFAYFAVPLMRGL
jgi:hypothetical protein